VDRQRWGDFGLVALAALALVMVVLAFSKQQDASAGPASASPTPVASMRVVQDGGTAAQAADTSTTPSMAAKKVDPSAPRAVFIGDSYTAGAGGDGTTWTGIVAEKKGWTEVNLGRGAGYVASVTGEKAKAACGQDTCPAYRELVDEAAAAKPDIIVVSGGRNDGAASVSNPAATLYLALHDKAPKARIIVVSPLWDDDPAPADLAGTKQGVRVAASRAGVEYLDIGQPLSGRADLVSADGTNPNAQGYQAIAQAVLAKLK